MNPKQNISLINALIRITFGFTFLAWSTAKLARREYKQSYLLIMLLAAMKIAEGIVRFCPVTALYNNKNDVFPIKQSNQQKQANKKDHVNTSSKEVAEIMEEFNPSTVFSPDDMK
ncbi:YgaP family membrane protein [Niallia sp. 03091]|uniref:YgaP family membrane protein n=1 Tax=unclassified Niallia TaxID=2837522 RepID=UPI0040442EB9